MSTAKSFDFETSEIMKVCEKYRGKKKEGNYQESLTELHLLATCYSLSHHEKTVGATSFPQSSFYSDLAELYRLLGDYKESFNYAEKALKGIPEKHADSIKPFCVLIRYYSEKK